MDVVSRIIEQERPIISMSALPQTSAQTSATTGTASAVTGSFRKTGEPDISESPLHPRRKSRRIMVGPVPVGGGAPISVQSMTNTLTANVPATLQQIAELTAAGCDIVRVAVPSQDDADALPQIVAKSPIPIIADIHFQSKYVFQAIDAGCAAVRVNPGNIRKFDQVGPDICKAATDAGVSLRIGVNAGSLDKELYAKYGGPTPEALVASALKEAHMFEDVGFRDFKISVKHHDVITMVQTYRLLASKGDWPLHLGVTEAGPAWQGTIKSCLAFGALLAEGIGDTIRVSLSAPPVEEVKVGCKLLEYMGLRKRKFDIISCPSCGRAQVDVIHRGTQERHRAHSRRRDGMHRQRAGRSPRGRSRRGFGQRQRTDLHQGQGHRDRAGRPDRRDAARAGQRHRRPDGGRRTGAGRRHRPCRHPHPASERDERRSLTFFIGVRPPSPPASGRTA